LPLAAQISGAQVHDSRLLPPIVEAIPAIKGLSGRARKRPGKLRADRAYALRAYRAWLRQRGIAARIARYGVESPERLVVGVGSSNDPVGGFTDFAGCVSATRAAQIFTKPSLAGLLAHLLAVR
jgi:hypothetical protein